MPPAWEPPHHSPTMANNKWAEFSNPQIGPDLQLRHKLYQLGDWEHAYFGKFEITPELHAEIVANFSADEPQNLNYNHVNDAISAGLIIEVEADTDADGWAWGTSLLTDAAAEYVRKREYRGFSAEIDFKAKDRKGNPVGAYLCGGALTNTPFFNIVLSDRRLAASAYPTVDESQAATAAEIPGEPMDPLTSRYDAETETLFVTLPDGTEMPVMLPEGFGPMEDMADMKRKQTEAESQMAAQVAASRQMNDRLLALERANIELKTQVGKERELRLSAEADAFLTTQRVKPSLREDVKEKYLLKGAEEARSFLSRLGDLAIVDEREHGVSATPELNDISFIDAEIFKLQQSNPKMPLSQIHRSVAKAYPAKFQRWEAGGM